MRAYTGIQTQISRNNLRSVLLIIAFPALLLSMVWLFWYIVSPPEAGVDRLELTNQSFTEAIPFVIGATLIWFLISYFTHTSIINATTGAKPLERRNNKKVYNLTENLCIAEGMPMPKLQIIETDALNAFASGINRKSYRVTLTRGLINKLDDHELEGVIAHELAHIKNKDVRLLIISLIFVGIFSLVAQIAFRSLLYGSMFRSRGNQKGSGQVMIIILVLAMIAYFFSMIFRFALSRKREYMADAEAVNMTKRPESLASALRKISGNFRVESVKSDHVAEMFIENQPDKSSGFMSFISGMFATHPPIEKRVKVLEQF